MNRYVSPSAWLFACLPLVAISACVSDRDIAIGVDCEDGFCDGGPTFTPPPPDGGDAETSVPADVAMCPVTTCTMPWATCPSSKFPCDADLLHDPQNCGGCGHDCGLGLDWSCVGGKCVFGCSAPATGDCDGDPSNGCEAHFSTDPNNCGDCGNRCAEGFVCEAGLCVDVCKTLGNRPDKCNGTCTNLRSDNANCGACGNACDPTGPAAPLPSDMYYGCVNSQCERPKCAVSGKFDCNGDVSDGCETEIHTNENCNKCGDACAPGKQCGYAKGRWACLCENDDETLCGTECKHLIDDPENCGGCGRVCPGMNYVPYFEATCTQGACGGKCESGYADCNELMDDGCEVNVRVDNRHCGACGNACLPEQVCFDGKCLVAPCSGGETTK
jgi:hypothetical protein